MGKYLLHEVAWYHGMAMSFELHLYIWKVDSDSSRSWLNALACIAKAECTMLESANGLDQALSEGISLLQKAELYLQVSPPIYFDC